MQRTEIADLIYDKLKENQELLTSQFAASKDTIGYFFIDDLLPVELVQVVYAVFPKIGEKHVVERKDIREFKHIAYQMNKYNTLLEELIYAFQDKKVVKIVGEICGKLDMLPDEFLYAGGLSLMGKENYLHPHLDNSHDKDRNRWRAVNLLYYVTPEWEINNGGNLELWPNGISKDPLTIISKFNRLVVMATHQNSWHSVSKVKGEAVRCCVSNYYFSDTPVLPTDTFHVTTFRVGSKNRKLDLVLKSDNLLRKTVRKIFKKGIRENPHQYKK
ncbi:2OG-Fe(II) oxygenase [Tenacibaculum sp. 190524A02b]|uniref:2OG-Fe(II) oxygenase n=1 Tax=Tenacibaculum vairaonense TaxID=3137860 RepID=UPI0032B1AC79